MMWNWGAMGMGWAWLATGLVVLVVLAAVVGIAFLASWSASRQPGTTAEPTPEELLAQRFARGEIDEQEYRLRREALAGR